MQNFLELAKTRRSVRTFDGQMPDAQIINELKEFAENITNPFGIKVRFVFLDAEENGLSSPVLAGEKLYVSAVVERNPFAAVAYGYSVEKFLMKAHELGLGTVWIGGTMPREKFEAATGLGENEVMPCISPLGVEAKKMSVKETLMRKGVKADTRYKFEELFYNGDFASPLSEGQAMGMGIRDDLESVRIAPSAVNKQPWRIVIDGKNAHFYVKHDKGYITPDYDLQVIDLGIALYNFESQMLCEKKNPYIVIEKPDIAVPEGIDYVATIMG